MLDLAGHREEAAAQSRKLLALSHSPERIGLAAGVLGRSGKLDEARAQLRRLESLSPEAEGRDLGLVLARLGLGDRIGGLIALEAATQRDPLRLRAYGLAQQTYDAVRDEPRFAAVLAKLNLDVTRLTLPDGGRSR